MNKKYFYISLTSIVSIFLLTQPAHAYGGPGVALGALVVFITVIITFFASFFLKIFKYLKRLYNFIRKLFSKNKSIKRKEVKKIKD